MVTPMGTPIGRAMGAPMGTPMGSQPAKEGMTNHHPGQEWCEKGQQFSGLSNVLRQ
jgi:hypothetical protein